MSDNMTLQKKLTNVGSYRLTGKKLGKGNFAKVEEALHTILNVKVSFSNNHTNFSIIQLALSIREDVYIFPLKL